jgi:hypothetical protein
VTEGPAAHKRRGASACYSTKCSISVTTRSSSSMRSA